MQNVLLQESRPSETVKIYTSYYAMYKHINPEFQCVSISNTKPSAIFIPKLKFLAPPWYFLDDYKHKKITWEFFSQMYMQYLSLNVGLEKLENSLRDFQSTDIVLMCYEQDYTKCHRTVLANYIKMFLPSFEVVGEIKALL